MFFDIFEKPLLSILNELIYSKFNHLICMQIDIMICYILHYTCMHTESMFYAKSSFLWTKKLFYEGLWFSIFVTVKTVDIE